MLAPRRTAGLGLASTRVAGAVAAQTVRPVIGVPIASGPLSGFDALLSTVQMPSGIPVATVAVGGAKNAGYLAAQIIAASDSGLSARLADDREANRQGVARQNASVQQDLAGED